jgi:hypothetical protein
MSVQAPSPKPNKVVWALTAVLCACTLVALWVTGARIKAMKIAARRGEVIEAAGNPAESVPSRVVLRRDQPVRVEHFSLRRNAAGNVEVVDAKERPLVEFVRIAKGQLRRWQELQLSFAEVSAEEATVDVDFKPGAACFGAGRYRALRPGLQVQLAKGSVTVTAWDPQAPEATLKFEGPGPAVERKVALHADGKIFGVAFRLEREHLLLDEAE